MQIELNEFVKQLYKQASSIDIEWNIAKDYFLNYIKNFRSIETYRFNLNHLNTISNYFEANNIYNVSQINDELLKSLSIAMIHKGNSNNYININLNIIKRVCKLISNDGLCSPIKLKFQNLKTKVPKIEIISEVNLQRILHYSLSMSEQNRCILYLLISTGIRRTEATFIKIKNIDMKSNSIYLDHTKTCQDRIIYFDSATKELITNLTRRNKEYLFESSPGQRITADSISSFIKRIKKELGIEILSPHKFRHTYATTLLMNGADLESVRRLLGHASYNMTSRYLHLENEKLKEVNKSCNPLTRLIH